MSRVPGYATLALALAILAGCNQSTTSDVQKQASGAAQQVGAAAQQAGQAAQQAAQNLATSAPAKAAKDDLILAAAKTRLATIDLSSTGNVHMRVRDGVVDLLGVASSAQEREAYAQAVRGIPGVKSVSNGIVVDPKAKTQTTGDFALAAKVTTALFGQTGMNAFSVKVVADNGTVTLTGTAPAAPVKSTMLATTRSVSGVTSVVDHITVKPR